MQKTFVSVRIIDGEMSKEHQQTALGRMKKYRNNYVTRSRCKGDGENRAVILGQNERGVWCQVVKIWGSNRNEAFNYANTLLRLERWGG